MMKLKFKSILFKILIMIILTCLMQGIILITMSYALTKKGLYSQTTDSGLKYVESNSQIAGEWFAGKINEITIYSNTSVVKTMDWLVIEPYLRSEISTKLDIYDHIFVADAAGNYSTTLKANAGNVSDRKYFSKVMKGNTVVSEPVISRTTGNQISVIAVPIKDINGKIIGLIGGALNLTKLNNFIANSAISHQDSYSYIIDKQGMIISYPDKSYIMKENITVKSQLIGASLVNASRQILENAKGYVQYIHSGVEGLNYYSTIPNTDGWKIIIKVPNEYLDAPLADASKNLVAMSIVGLLISVLLAIYISKSISHPIIQLSDVFTKATNGDLSVRALNYSNDEIGQASKSFNKMMETISNLTFYDTLTALPNKLQFMDRLNHEIADCIRDNEKLAVVIFDIDKFENVNNALGHSAGDEFLRLLAAEIMKHLDENEIACRLSEDRFAILLSNNPHETYAIRTSMKLLEMMKQPWKIDKHYFYMTASLGVAFYPNDGEDSESLLKNALSAMLKAKKSGRGNYQLYDSKVSSKLLDIIELDNYMHQALDNNEFILHYQPQVDISSGKIIGAEALIRWSNPKLGMISPVNFIPLAEENGLIVPIGDWVLRTACTQNKKWMDMGYDPVYISVNISAVQISQCDFIEKVSKILEETQLDPKYLELEITESIAMEDTETRIKILEALRSMGIRIAIDDFGTGYSSLNYLRRFQVTTLKIDQSFTKELVSNTKDAAIVSTILAIGQNLNLTVTAEGVETKEQLDILREKNCDTIQGYLYSRPVPREEFERLLKNPPVLS
ncbi:MAG: sensor-containing diguanylate cyclase/phosphodiesterase [Clostridia bacterium]|nr:sensor-containing diguanylate cyclase/phosphodiesterase [Clostridia bacterium]